MNANWQKAIFLRVLWSYHGTWYQWGGDDPSGFDCSGLVIEALQSVGIVGHKFDTTAAGLWDGFKRYRASEPKAGYLVFWQNAAGKVVHVEVCLNEHVSIGAKGGGSGVTTVAEARKRNAFVKVRPILGRKAQLKGFIDVFSGLGGSG